MRVLGLLILHSQNLAAAPFKVPASHIRGCAAMVGADFACSISDGSAMDACQLQNSREATQACTNIRGCLLVVIADSGWATLKGSMDFSAVSEPARGSCTLLSREAVDNARNGRSCDPALQQRWRQLQCMEHARPNKSLIATIPPRPASLSTLLPPPAELTRFACAPNKQLLNPHPVLRMTSNNCISPSPTENKDACSFLRHHALRMCLELPSCQVLHCETMSDYCQVLQDRYSDGAAEPSFGDVDLLVKNDAWDGGATSRRSAQVCISRHYYATGAGFGIGSAHFGKAPPHVLKCTRRGLGFGRDFIVTTGPKSSGDANGCMKFPASDIQITASAARLRALLITSAQRFSTRSTMFEPVEFVRKAPSYPLLLYEPQPALAQTMQQGEAERGAYMRKYHNDRWLTDVQEVYHLFFGSQTTFGQSGRTGFYIEAGAVQGTVYDSNSLFFERFLGWTGLLVEANPFSYAKLMVRRPAAYKIETALCAATGILRFNLPDNQRNADGCCGRANGKGKYPLRCTRLGDILEQIGILHVDFWSLDGRLHPPLCTSSLSTARAPPLLYSCTAALGCCS